MDIITALAVSISIADPDDIGAFGMDGCEVTSTIPRSEE
jgi:hypothetical protein